MSLRKNEYVRAAHFPLVDAVYIAIPFFVSSTRILTIPYGDTD